MSVMPLIANWRGRPNATTYSEALQVFELANLTKKDVFYDLGCGYGWVCIWAARRCKSSKGIESHKHLVAKARKNVQKSGLRNVEIIRGDFTKARLSDASVVYCVTDRDFNDFRRWDRRKRKKDLRIVTLGPPPIPVKPVRSQGSFYLTKFPFATARTADEWCHAVFRKGKGTFDDVRKELERRLSNDALAHYRRDFKKHFA